VSAGREKHPVQLAVTGTGEFFGVLKYPVALFLSTDHTPVQTACDPVPIKLDGLGNGAILLLDCLIVCAHIHGVLAALGVGFF